MHILLKVMWEITFELTMKFTKKMKHREETRTNLQSSLMGCLKFPYQTGPVRELRAKSSQSEPSCRTHSGKWDGMGYTGLMRAILLYSRGYSLSLFKLMLHYLIKYTGGS